MSEKKNENPKKNLDGVLFRISKQNPLANALNDSGNIKNNTNNRGSRLDGTPMPHLKDLLPQKDWEELQEKLLKIKRAREYDEETLLGDPSNVSKEFEYSEQKVEELRNRGEQQDSQNKGNKEILVENPTDKNSLKNTKERAIEKPKDFDPLELKKRKMNRKAGNAGPDPYVKEEKPKDFDSKPKNEKITLIKKLAEAIDVKSIIKKIKPNTNKSNNKPKNSTLGR